MFIIMPVVNLKWICRARAVGCNNAATPDMYGHYREAKFTMTKHHWWWKVRHAVTFVNTVARM